MSKPILTIENDAQDPVARLGDWLIDAGATLVVVRPHLGDDLPTSLDDYSGVVVLGGAMAAFSDEGFSWRGATLDLLRAASAQNVPTLGICLGAQLVAVALGGTVEAGHEGPEVGHGLVARRDLSYDDPLFDLLPMTPDALHFHYDEISVLPPGAVLLLGGPGYPNQAFRVGSSTWAIQFHIETEPEVFADWAETDRENLEDLGMDVDLMIERAVAAHAELPSTWAPFAAAFAKRSAEYAEGRDNQSVGGDA